jgi:hypothetical protein
MALSPNYQWAEPDNSSLVKNGAQDIRALGDAIDTSLWNVGYGQAGKNRLINGLFDIWQRGTSSTTTNNYGSADRWVQYAISGTGTFSQDASVIPSGSRYSMKFVASATAQPSIIQVVETMNTIPLAGQTVTLSAFVANSTSANMDFILGYSTTVDEAWTGTYTTITSTAGSNTLTGITTTLSRRSLTFAIPSTAKTLRVWIRTTATIASAATVNWGGVMLEVGSVATPLVRNGSTIQAELSACQRYYYRVQPTTNARFGIGMAKTTSIADAVIPYPVTMRIAPTALEQSGTAGDYGITYLATGAVCNVVPVLVVASNSAMTVTFGVSAVLTAGNAVGPYAVNTNAYLGWSAEL